MKLNLRFSLRFCFITLILVSFNAIVKAQTIKGNVSDAKTGDVLIGATVHIEKGDFKLNTTVKLDGTYVFKNVPAGVYKIQVKFVGYNTTKEYAVEATQGAYRYFKYWDG